MVNPTMHGAVASAMASRIMPSLLASEDFDTFESMTADATRRLGLEAMRRCVEAFDVELSKHARPGWSVHERASRTLVTLLGAMTYTRTIYDDEYGRRRALADELLGIPARARISTGAFLWICRRAAELSYRKTAEAFAEVSGCAISHVSVMSCVHREGALLKSAAPPAAGRVSQDRVFVEVDGLWVHLQETSHREAALPRFLYEQARKTTSFELKMACAYAGKRRVAPGRFERGGLTLTCADAPPDEFWARVVEMVGGVYKLEDIESVVVGADGGSWCSPEAVEEALPEAEVIQSLDPFHIMQKIWRAFPAGASRDWAVNLAVRRRPGQLARMCSRLSAREEDPGRRRRIEELGSYMRNNARAVTMPVPSLGTMEGTNAHVGAARLKGQGRSWSRRGAEAMCLIRCALSAGRELVAPPKAAFFTEEELARVEGSCAVSAGSVALAEGEGYMPPHQADTRKMVSRATYKAWTC